MKLQHLTLLSILGSLGILASLTSCVETTDGTVTGSATETTPSAPVEKLTKHDAALRFLTAYIRQDRAMALRYADAAAVSKLDWNVPHSGNIPYYDDKMLLQFRGGWARVYFQEVDGSFRVSNLDVHRR